MVQEQVEDCVGLDGVEQFLQYLHVLHSHHGLLQEDLIYVRGRVWRRSTRYKRFKEVRKNESVQGMKERKGEKKKNRKEEWEEGRKKEGRKKGRKKRREEGSKKKRRGGERKEGRKEVMQGTERGHWRN